MRRNVLLVDDDELVLTLLETFLEQAGFECRSCKDGYSAITELQNYPYDLIVLDISMPYMSGLKVLRTIKSDVDLQEIPVIMLTSSSDVKDIQDAAKYGVTDYVLKPPKKEDLLERIERVLGGRPQYQEISVPEGDRTAIGTFQLKIRLKSLSRKGMVLEGSIPLPRDLILSHLDMPAFQQMKLDQSRFRIVECTEPEEGVFNYHISFVSLGKADQEKIADKVMKDSFASRNNPKKVS